MSSPERNIEALVIAILEDADLGVDVMHHDADDDTVDKPSRVEVKCAPKAVEKSSRNGSLAPKIWQAAVTVTIRGFTDKDAAAFDTIAQDVDDALWPANNTYPAAVVTSANSLFPNGLKLDTPNDGGKWDGNSEVRTLARNFRAVFRL